jgi:hypothetical protein
MYRYKKSRKSERYNLWTGTKSPSEIGTVQSLDRYEEEEPHQKSELYVLYLHIRFTSPKSVVCFSLAAPCIRYLRFSQGIEFRRRLEGTGGNGISSILELRSILSNLA